MHHTLDYRNADFKNYPNFPYINKYAESFWLRTQCTRNVIFLNKYETVSF